jgi:hypothetical protein
LKEDVNKLSSEVETMDIEDGESSEHGESVTKPSKANRKTLDEVKELLKSKGATSVSFVIIGTAVKVR